MVGGNNFWICLDLMWISFSSCFQVESEIRLNSGRNPNKSRIQIGDIQIAVAQWMPQSDAPEIQIGLSVPLVRRLGFSGRINSLDPATTIAQPPATTIAQAGCSGPHCVQPRARTRSTGWRLCLHDTMLKKRLKTSQNFLSLREVARVRPTNLQTNNTIRTTKRKQYQKKRPTPNRRYCTQGQTSS